MIPNLPPTLSRMRRDLKRGLRNWRNARRKTFRDFSLDDIETTVRKQHGTIEFTKIAEAKEYRETVAIREQAKVTVEQKVAEKFPSVLTPTN